jgi:phosphotransferase system enzyme I (PtsI)
MAKQLKGIAVSDGIAVAKAYLLVEPDLSFEKKSIENVDQEVARLTDALGQSTVELQAIRDKAAKSLGEEEAQVFDAHLMVLSDPELIGAVESNRYVYRYVRKHGRQSLHARACC